MYPPAKSFDCRIIPQLAKAGKRRLLWKPDASAREHHRRLNSLADASGFQSAVSPNLLRVSESLICYLRLSFALVSLVVEKRSQTAIGRRAAGPPAGC